ncbi:hypothetical protein HHI36_011176 [Cryptolaemus montrouzieri]|uniref:Uncharacterized protein n=1 Tax=Cryptolaemus montrouzieri TaxID=559131 RepID=A0ABD2MLB3_9CUCU
MANQIVHIIFAVFLMKSVLSFPQSATSSTSDSTEEPSNPPLSDLEASFGGSTTTTTTSAPESTTVFRKTGFYYLLDWNSFLDVDDVMGTRVNLRLQPKIGDPKRFYAVRTP